LSFATSGYPECAPELIAFRNANREIPRDRAYFDWRYLGRPCAATPIVVWAELGSEPVGALTICPHDFHVLEAERIVGVMGDISVRRESRGLGIAAAMFNFLPQIDAVRDLHGCLVLPNEGAAAPLSRSGWKEAHRIERFAKVLDFQPRLARLMPRRWAGILAAPLNVLARALSHETAHRATRLRAAIVSQVDDRFDELWRRADKQGRIIGLRNARYLRWRYQQHPMTTYHKLAMTEGETLSGYAIYRVAEGTCFVEDIFCIDASHAVAVVSLLLMHLREQGSVSTVSLGINRSAMDRPWRPLGFSRRRDFQRTMISGGAGWGGTSAAWHLTSGDKDV